MRTLMNRPFGARPWDLSAGITLLVSSVVMLACISDKGPGFDQGGGDTLTLDTEIDGAVEVRDETEASVEVRASGSSCTNDAECATGHCLLGQGGHTCAFDCAVTNACPSGLECRTLGDVRVCVDRYVFACRPCNSASECDGGAAAGDLDGGENECIAIDDDITSGRFCGVRCGGIFGDCKEGYTCIDQQCRPSDGTCECSPAAVEADATTACGRTVADAQCRGQRTCADVGSAPTACDAPEGEPELCDGRDNDCDDATDEDADCGDYACKGATGCASTCDDNADCAPGLACDVDDRDGDQRRNECARTGDNGTSCKLATECDSGYCNNDYCCDGTSGDVLCCALDADCAALDGEATCTDAGLAGCIGLKNFGRCRGSICTVETLPSSEGCIAQVCRGAQCSNGGVLDGAHLCGPLGECIETADRSCDDDDPCTNDTCNANSGCGHAPTSGATSAACYSFDALTRGVGACKDGVTICQNGAASACSGERGPALEVCNGADDDCDGTTDEDTEPTCFPYLCRGDAGCAKDCDGHEDCAAGNFCSEGECASTGENGSTCTQNDECQSGYCEGGVCCEDGLCCRGDHDCAELEQTLCDTADANGCTGTRVRGVCDVGSQCREEHIADASACDGFICEGASCDGGEAKPAASCLRGLCQPSEPVSCSPYACDAGACLVECEDDDGCSNGATCDDDGACTDLPDGAACHASADCASNHCNNGFCCDSGLCCGDADTDCAALTTAGTCDAPGTCSGKRNVGTCGADHQCTTETVDTPAPCEGRLCGGVECANIDGNELVLEGISEDRCNATGGCVEVTRDCRARTEGVCTDNSSLFFTCGNCAGNRTTCVLFDNPCICE